MDQSKLRKKPMNHHFKHFPVPVKRSRKRKIEINNKKSKLVEVFRLFFSSTVQNIPISNYKKNFVKFPGN